MTSYRMERRSTQRAQGSLSAEPAKSNRVRINGVAAVFYDGTPRTEFELAPGFLERILPGAFARAIREDDVRALFNHSVDHVLGRSVNGTLELRQDSRGLHYSIIANPNDPAAESLIAKLKRGDVSGSSFSFNIAPDGQRIRLEKRGGVLVKVREILAVDPLYDVGPVTFPAYRATTAAVKVEGDDRSAGDADKQRAMGLQLLFGNGWRVGDEPRLTVRGQCLLQRPGGLARLVNEGELADIEARQARLMLASIGESKLGAYMPV